MAAPKIKICGITKAEEVIMLNEVKVDYAGFVFFEKSKRNVSIHIAKELINNLNPAIKKVAVTVNPDLELVKKIEMAGFDILQVHKELSKEVAKQCDLPIWFAVNISNTQELKVQLKNISNHYMEATDKISAYVVDGAEYGSGKTFAWQNIDGEIFQKIRRKQFVLAGGLTAQNVMKGIQTFSPDIVDVSSGVEGNLGGKDVIKIKEFVRKVRENE